VSGFVSFLFTLLLTVALTLAVVDWREKKRRLAMVFGIISFICAVVTVIAGAIYYFHPVQSVVQVVGPPGKPYVFIKDSRVDTLTVGANPVITFALENGPVESTITFTDVSFKLTPFVPEKYLKYLKGNEPQTFKLLPHQVVTVRWTFFTLALTQEQINELNEKNPSAELYFFARGEYTDETGTHPLPWCRQYDRDFPNHLAFCADDMKIN
jgi:hypothetical protein